LFYLLSISPSVYLLCHPSYGCCICQQLSVLTTPSHNLPFVGNIYACQSSTFSPLNPLFFWSLIYFGLFFFSAGYTHIFAVGYAIRVLHHWELNIQRRGIGVGGIDNWVLGSFLVLTDRTHFSWRATFFFFFLIPFHCDCRKKQYQSCLYGRARNVNDM